MQVRIIQSTNSTWGALALVHPVANSSELGNVLARLRKSSKLIQADISKKAQLCQATISKVENGDKGVRFDTVMSVLASMDMKIVIRPKAPSGNE